MDVSTLNTAQSPYYELSDKDIEYIESMANFYDISREEDLERFLCANIEGNVLTEDEIKELEQYS